jgi:hypothetical protein
VTRGLFEADLPRLYGDLRSYDIPQVALDPSRIAAECLAHGTKNPPRPRTGAGSFVCF